MKKLVCLFFALCLFTAGQQNAHAQQGGQTSTIPPGFWGMSFNQYCDISSASNTPCNGGSFAFPSASLQVNWSRTLGSGITWNTLELCDPNGNWCPIAGSGCAANYDPTPTDEPTGGKGTNNALATDINGKAVTCLRPNGIDGFSAVQICPTGTGGGSALWCMPGLTPNPCIPSSYANTTYPIAANNPANCAYTWNWNNLNLMNGVSWYKDQFDEFVGQFNGSNGGVPLMLTLAVTPDFLSIEGSRCTGLHTSYNGTDLHCYAVPNVDCASEFNFGPSVGLSLQPSEGGCNQAWDADSSVSAAALGNGTGPNNYVSYLVQAMFNHMSTTQSLQFIEIGNEPNNCNYWDHRDGGGGGSSSSPCPNNNGTGNSSATASGNDLVKMGHVVRTVAHNTGINKTGTTPLIVSPPTVGPGSYTGYLATILNEMSTMALGGGVVVGTTTTTNQFDAIGFHGYYAAPSTDPTGQADQWCYNEPATGGGGTALVNCPQPEGFTQTWSEIFFTLNNGGSNPCPNGSIGGSGNYTNCDPYYSYYAALGGYPPTIDTEYSWQIGTNVVNGDEHGASVARSVILQAQFYPMLTAIDWYGEDFGTVPQTAFNNGCTAGGPPCNTCTSGLLSPPCDPGGGPGQLWSPTTITTNIDTDACTTLSATQGGYLCNGGLAWEVANNWFRQGPLSTQPRRAIIAASVGSAQSCTCSNPTGHAGNCSPTAISGLPPTGIFVCQLEESTSTGTNLTYFGELVWDNTKVTFPCSSYSTSAQKAVCGNTTYTLPTYTEPGGTMSNFQNGTSQWQPLSGVAPTTIGTSQTTVQIGAKPILIENQHIVTAFTPSN